MWGSSLIGDMYDTPVELSDALSKTVVNALSQHPYFDMMQTPIEKSTSSIFTSDDFIQHKFPVNGDGWVEATLGKSADKLIRSLRKMRRQDKENKFEIDGIISDITTLKALETKATLENLSWGQNYTDVIYGLGLSDRKLKALRKFGETRSVSLIQACEQYRNADTTLKMLDEHEGGWGEEEERAWATAMKSRTDARKMWSTTLNQIDNLSKHDIKALDYISKVLQENGPTTSRTIVSKGIEEGHLRKSFTPTKLSMLIKMYGEEVDIMKGVVKNTFVKMDSKGLVIKDVWSYAAGFLDADGSIFITERGEPRASFVATGSRGKAHCEQMHKALGCGTLALDQRISKNSNRTTHRLIFSSKEHLNKLLKGVLSHLKMKGLQAKAVLAYMDNPDSLRKNELKRLVRYENWKDDKVKAARCLEEWGIDRETVTKYAEGL